MEVRAQVEQQVDSPRKEVFVVGIGASAGGLESLENLFANVPEDSGMAYVVIQHLSPDFKSMMDELLARHTKVPIHRVRDGMLVEPNNIYLLPPKQEMIVASGRLHLTAKDPKQGLTLPIDHFFRSLAQDYGDHAIAVILSGTGSDGSRGIKDVHKAGGLVVSEDEKTAKFDGMPLSAQETGFVDLILKAQEIPAALMDHKRSPLRAKEGPKPVDAAPLEGIEGVFDLLRREYDIDFSHYKPTTVSRRIERRLSLLQIESLDEYGERLRDDSDELNALYKDLLIGVTRFFRDTEAFQFLERQVIPDVLDRVGREDEIRVWVAGCATGEEAYSIAILLHEALEKAQRPVNVKIFATDVHKVSLERAGHGLFDEEGLMEVSPERLRRYFTRKQTGYQISQDLRQLIVFAQHNVIKDAPFTNLDLISCRNLLIYFQPQAQKKALSMFHFGLKTGATLLLGGSESPGELADEFDVLDERSKAYRKRRDIRLPAELRLSLTRPTESPRALQPPMSRSAAALADASLVRVYDKLLEKCMPPSLLINDRRELVESFGGAEQLLRIQSRRLSRDLLDLLDTDAKTSIAGALNRVVRHGKPLSFSGVSLKTHGQLQTYRLGIEPIEDIKSGQRHYLITLEPLDQPHAQDPARAEVNADDMSRDQVRHLEDELRYTKENLQATIEELETSNEEMQATNEELVASNEELQSTNEELHSVNEELYTVNAEHQKKIQELAELNQDMEHLLRSTDVAILFLDRDLRIRKYTPRTAAVFDLVDHDIGRRVGTFSHRIQYDRLVEDLQDVLAEGKPREREVRDAEGRCFFMRILPYRVGNEILGVVLSLIDISVLDEARGKISLLSAIVESSADAIIGMTLDGIVTSWNRGAQKLYGRAAEEMIGKSIATVVPPDKADELSSILDRLRHTQHIASFETLGLHKDGRRSAVSLSVSPIMDAAGRLIGGSVIARDITDRLRLEQKFRATIESAPTGMVMVDRGGKIVLVNAESEKLFGYAREELLGKPVELLVPPRYRERHHRYILQYYADAQPRRTAAGRELHGLKKDGTEFPVEIGLSPIETEEGTFVLSSIADITIRKEATDKLHAEARRREQFLAMLSHELRNPLSAIRTATLLLNTPGLDEASDLESRRVIDRQTTQMTRLLDDLLDISRITQNKIRLSRCVLDLRETVDDAVDSVKALACDCGVKMDIVVPEHPLPVNGDAARLAQIQANLLSNAIKYSSAGGQVRIELSEQNGMAMIRVIDSGVGIAPDMLHRIFEMFVQADDTLDRARGGMGVGLTLVRSLVDLHGGEVTARSEGLGRGSEFEVRLPLVAETPVARHSPAHNQSPVTQQRIAIIEDQEDNRLMLMKLLQIEGATVFGAATGPEGLELVEKERPSAVVIDIGLPRMDGYEVARRIRLSLGSDILLIALTGYGQPQDIELARAAGFDHHMVKPVQPDRLMQMLNLRAKPSHA